MFSNKKGLAQGLLAFTLVLFSFGLMVLVSHVVWNPFNQAIQDLDESIADNYTKQKIDDLSSYINWGDKLFTIFLITLLIAYLITSFTLPAQNAWFFLLFIGFIVLVTFFAMILSNSWTFILSDPFFSSFADNVKITDYVLRHFPIISFLVGIIGGVVFYSRSREDNPNIGDPGMGGQEF